MKLRTMLFKYCGLVMLILLSIPHTTYAQITISNTTYTVNQLVNGVLVPASSGTAISNINYRGVYNVSSRYQIGYLSTATSTQTAMGFANGIVLTTGNTTDIPLALGSNPGAAAQMSRNYVSGTTGEVRASNAPAGQDADIANLIAPENYYNGVVLEFDFVPVYGSVQFRYIFGSEEYDDQSGSAFAINYNCSQYNDKFAMLVSGPGIAGGQGYANNAKNIARLANNSVVGINSVNGGLVGSSGGAPSAANCTAANPAWVNNSPTAEFLGFINGTQLNGNTRVLTAYQNGLTPGQTYHLKIILADAKDGAYDSVVYLEASSFTTENTGLPVEFVGLEATCQNRKGIQLDWSTESERLNDYFLVERSSDLNPEFVLVDTIKSKGSSSQKTFYQLMDKKADQGTNYYRLTQVDYDGRKTELAVEAVDATCSIENPWDYDLYYDEATNSFQLSYKVDRERNVEFVVVDLTGQLVQRSELELKTGTHKERIQLDKPISAGTYLVQIGTDTESYVTKFIK